MKRMTRKELEAELALAYRAIAERWSAEDDWCGKYDRNGLLSRALQHKPRKAKEDKSR